MQAEEKLEISPELTAEQMPDGVDANTDDSTQVDAAIDAADATQHDIEATQKSNQHLEQTRQASQACAQSAQSADASQDEPETTTQAKATLDESPTQTTPAARKNLAASAGADEEHDEGIAAWVLTFADLMSLLMAFFVLLYSMSEVDKAKFDQFGKSMKQALGKKIEFNDDVEEIQSQDLPTPAETKENLKKTKMDAQSLKKLLEPQIQEQKVEVEQHGQVIMIRMLQKGVFKSGESGLEDSFIPVLEKISAQLNEIKGELIVSGHTDDVPVKKEAYRSNWELSASRAYSVIEVLRTMRGVDDKRFVLRGYGSTRPLAPNDTPENRAKNRRVEIMIDQRMAQGDDNNSQDGADIQKTADDVLAQKGSL